MTIDSETTLAFLRHALGLKYIPRTGWLQRGLHGVESVADHSWGMALVVLALAEGMGEEFDRGKAVTIALLHDLPERVLSDIPTPAARYLPDGAKRRAEEAVLAEMLGALADSDRLQAWWREFEDGSTPEGQLVQDADRLEMLIQVLAYEQERGIRLDEFWRRQADDQFHLPVSRAVYRALVQARAGTDEGSESA